MTGATGSLGAFLLHQLVSLPPNVVERVVCFVRAENHEDAHRRVTRVLEKRGLNVSNAEGRFTALAAEVSQDRLGLDAMRYRELVGSVDVVIHVSCPYPGDAHLRTEIPADTRRLHGQSISRAVSSHLKIRSEVRHPINISWPSLPKIKSPGSNP